MKRTEYIDTLVLGAGMGGLSIACLEVRENANIGLLDAHYNVGGCAGFFSSNGHIYDAGATTLSGLEHDRPLAKFLKLLEIDLDYKKVDPGIVVHMPDLKISRYAEHDVWLKELKRKFPTVDAENFWQTMKTTHDKSWQLLADLKDFPPKSFGDYLSLLNLRNLRYFDLLKSVLTPVRSLLSESEKDNLQYMQLLNEMLMISTQNVAADTPVLYGSLGLCYPEETYYATGGMKGLCDALKNYYLQKGGQLFLKTKVEKIEPVKDGFIVHCRNKKFRCKKVFANLTQWNLKEVLPPDKSGFLDSRLKRPSDTWGAMTKYFSVKLATPPSGLYHQIHTFEKRDYLPSKSMFYSLSHPDDRSRHNIPGWQTITVSAHASIPKIPDGSDPQAYQSIKCDFSSLVHKQPF